MNLQGATNRNVKGWTIHISGGLFQMDTGNKYYRTCGNNGMDWYGYCDGYNCGSNKRNLGSIETTLSGCGTAKLDYGNCYEHGEVRVYLDGNQIDVAYPHTPNKIVEFEFKEGSKLKITEGEDGDNCMMKFSSFNVINCIHC